MADKKTDMVHESIALVMGSIGSVGKGGTTPQYKYRSYEQVIKALQPLFIEHGLYATTSITDVSVNGQMTTGVVTYRVTSSNDGSYVETSVLAQGSDRADKGAYKLMSGAIKYAYGQLFMIPFEGDDAEDPRNDASNYKPERKAQPQNKPPALDENYEPKINLAGDRKPLKDCDAEELNFALAAFRTAAGGQGGHAAMARALVDVCEKIANQKGIELAPF